MVLRLGPLGEDAELRRRHVRTTRTPASQNVWTYDPDLSRPAFLNAFQRSVNLRLTWQASAKNKFSFFVDDQGRCQCANVTATMAPEAAISIEYPIQRMVTVGWTSPVTNRLLLEARAGFRGENYKYNAIAGRRSGAERLITVTEQASVNGAPAGLHVPRRRHRRRRRSTQPYQNTYGRNIDVLAAATYVTGAHVVQDSASATRSCCANESLDDNIYHVSYRFNNGVPNQITERTTPYQKSQRQPAGIGLYAQDKWTLATADAQLRACGSTT